MQPWHHGSRPSATTPLGFERAGLRCVWQVEIDDFCRRVLAKHWPDVRRHDDVRTFPPAGDWQCDVICGGFPCQDISNAGKKAGLAGERSGLWSEFHRIIRVVRPRFVVVENVAALLDRGMGAVLADLAESGFDAEWTCVPAAALGALHLRERIFIVAHRDGNELHGSILAGRPLTSHPHWQSTQDIKTWDRRIAQLESMGIGTRHSSYADARRMVDGVPDRMDRLSGIGNAVVPQVAEFIGRQLLAVVT